MIALRPLYLYRGLSRREWKKSWPGDQTVAKAKPSGSRAILIQAPCEAVWPWITQIGQDRAGFYSYRWLENLMGAQMPDVREIHSQWSHREVGEYLVMAPIERYGDIARMKLAEEEPIRRLTYVNKEGVWSFILEPVASDQCRFICRGTWIPSHNPLAHVARWLIFDPGHYLMEWKMMRSIKALAEQMCM